MTTPPPLEDFPMEVPSVEAWLAPNGNVRMEMTFEMAEHLKNISFGICMTTEEFLVQQNVLIEIYSALLEIQELDPEMH